MSAPEPELPPSDRNADLKRGLLRLVMVIALAVLGVLGLVWYLWERSPKPP